MAWRSAASKRQWLAAKAAWRRRVHQRKLAAASKAKIYRSAVAKSNGGESERKRIMAASIMLMWRIVAAASSCGVEKNVAYRKRQMRNLRKLKNGGSYGVESSWHHRWRRRKHRHRGGGGIWSRHQSGWRWTIAAQQHAWRGLAWQSQQQHAISSSN